MILAIDPGTDRSAWMVYDVFKRRPVEFGIVTNPEMMQVLAAHADECQALVIEQIASYGMPVGVETFQTVWWYGRFHEYWITRCPQGAEPHYVTRMACKMHLCGSARAKDANVRQALLDRWGGKEKAIGRKASPGPLYGIKADLWSALAVAVTSMESHIFT